MARFSSLSGGIGNNKNIRSQITYILNKTVELASRTQKNKTLKIFYSWQSALPSKTNRGLIRHCLDKAVSEINKGLSVESRVTLDSDTSNTPGSPDIINTILEKIDSSQLFVADVSLVNSSQPNANVMFELGYAMKVLGDQNIIMVFNESYGSTKDLPFDLGFKRQMLYSCPSSEEDMASVKKSLTSKLKSAISLILDNE